MFRLPFPANLLAAFAGLVAAPAALAQQGVLVPVDSTAREVVQPLPPEGAAELNAALKRLAGDPRDVSALLAAGNASLKLQDVDAAIGFFTRAQALDVANGEAMAGLAAAQVYKKKPVEALRLFAAAQQAGASLAAHAGDYGLAYDLVGDNPRAQDLYRSALERGPNDEITRRLALSQAIGGDQAGSERTLLPLLQHRDLASYRTRAFALAALGKTDEAVSIAEAMMPASLAGRIAPYLRYMPKLTRAQQAAAANFGHFPEAGVIGVDDPRIAEYTAAARSAEVAARPSDARLVPAGEPLGPSEKPAPPPAGPVIAMAVADTQPAGAIPQAAVSVSASAAASRRFDLGGVSGSAPAAISPAQAASEEASALRSGPIKPPAATPEPAKPQPSLADAFAEFDTVKPKAGPAPGAVDVTGIAPSREVEAKPEPAKPIKSAKPANPSRIWVQVATGADRKALGHDWGRLTGKAAKAFRGRSGYLAKWGKTNRLLTGPFASQDDAQDYVRELKKAGISSFTYSSAQGEEIAPLSRR
jgi:tetratricopeptide (TPR) repeat protein